MLAVNELTPLQINTYHVCATSWQQEGFTLPNCGEWADIQALCGHLSLLMQLHTANIEGYAHVRTHELIPAKGQHITQQLSFLFMHGLVKLGAHTEYSWVALTPSGTALAHRLRRPPKQVAH